MTALSLQPHWSYTLNETHLPKKVIALPMKEGFRLVKLEDILYCKAEGNYTQILFLNGETMLISRKLKETSASLQGGLFQRIHQSYLININHARMYLRKSGGQLIMSDGVKLPISKTYKEAVLNLFKFV